MDKVITPISLAKRTNDGTKWSIEDALKQALEEVGKRGAFEKGKKILIIALDESDGYSINWIQSGMKMSECLALCEVAKTQFLTEYE